MFASWKLARIAGIDVFIHPTFLILLVVIGLTQGGLLAAGLITAVFACVLLHEYGHALMARAYGIHTRDITLYPIGGVARLERMPRSPGAELAITLAGPAVNLLIAGLLALVQPLFGVSNLPGEFLANLLWVNLFMALFNLIPAFPMDGGRIFRALLSLKLGRANATEIAASLGQFLAVALPFILLALGIVNPLHWFLAFFLWSAAGVERRQVRLEERARLWKTSHPFGRWIASHSSDGVWTAPPGYTWVCNRPGVWQLVPIPVPADDQRDFLRWN
jgi:Zn-dependent protease